MNEEVFQIFVALLMLVLASALCLGLILLITLIQRVVQHQKDRRQENCVYIEEVLVDVTSYKDILEKQKADWNAKLG